MTRPLIGVYLVLKSILFRVQIGISSLIERNRLTWSRVRQAAIAVRITRKTCCISKDKFYQVFGIHVKR